MSVEQNPSITGAIGIESLNLADLIDVPSTGIVPPANLGSGSGITTKYLRGDSTWQTVSASETVDPSVCSARLTLITGDPYNSSYVASGTTIYLTPYLGDQIALYNGSAWAYHTLTQKSLALSGLTTGKQYDVFVYSNSGTLTLELSAAWTNDTTRADGITITNGVPLKTGALTRRLVGTFRTHAVNATRITKYFVNLINYNHRLDRTINLDCGYTDDDSGTSFTLAATSGALALIRAGTGDNGGYISYGENEVRAYAQATYTEVSTRNVLLTIGDNSTSNQTASSFRTGVAAGLTQDFLKVRHSWLPAFGFRTINLLASVDTSTHTFFADFNDNMGGTLDPQMTFLQLTVKG